MMEHFWKACDAPGPLVLDVERSDAPGVERYTLAQPFAMLGRDPRADIPLTHDDVSRRHLFLHVIGGSVHALDLGSRTGTRWAEGARHSGWLLPGQSLRVGPFAIRCMSVGRSAPPEVGSNLAAGPLESTPPDLEQASLWPRLALVYGAGPKRKTWRMKRVATLVGSGIGCGPRLADPSVSSRHCALLRTPLGPWVVDLLGRGGFLINGSIARFAPLEHGDQLRIGKCPIIVRCKPAVTAPATSMVLAPWTGGAGESVPAVPLVQLERLQEQLFEQFQQIMVMVVQRFDTLHRDQVDRIRGELECLVVLREDLQGLKGDVAAQATGPVRPRDWKPLEPPRTDPAAPPVSCEPARANEPTADVILTLQERLAAIQSEQQTRWQRILGFLAGQTREGPAL